MMCVSVPSVSLLRSPGRCRWLSSSGVRLPGVVSLRPTRRSQRRSPPANALIPMFRLYTPLRPSGGARLVEPFRGVRTVRSGARLVGYWGWR